jgi:CHASE2 domain-containing sensor protein
MNVAEQVSSTSFLSKAKHQASEAIGWMGKHKVQIAVCAIAAIATVAVAAMIATGILLGLAAAGVFGVGTGALILKAGFLPLFLSGLNFRRVTSALVSSFILFNIFYPAKAQQLKVKN